MAGMFVLFHRWRAPRQQRGRNTAYSKTNNTIATCGMTLQRSVFQPAPMAIATIGFARRLQLPAGILDGSDGLGIRGIKSADLSVQIGHPSICLPSSSDCKSVCSRKLLSFAVRDRTEFRRTIASHRNCKSAEKSLCSGDGGSTSDKLLERERLFSFTTLRTRSRPSNDHRRQKSKTELNNKNTTKKITGKKPLPLFVWLFF